MNDKKTLYISDLDGTLLNSDKKISEKSVKIINDLIKKGMNFTFATARSFNSATRLTKDLNLKLPAIICNGVFTIDPKSQKISDANYFSPNDSQTLNRLLQDHEIFPIVYSHQNKIEKLSWTKENASNGLKKFVDDRPNDKRFHLAKDIIELFNGDNFYLICIDSKQKLEPIYQQLKNNFSCYFHKEFYTNEYWLEIIPSGVSKASAIKKLKENFNFTRIVSFGDQTNDIPMFELADESYAVKNAVPELKKIATDVINENNNDGVATWLKNNLNEN